MEGIAVGGFAFVVCVVALIILFVPTINKLIFPNRHRAVIPAAELN